MNGLVLVDKPAGCTSHDVVNRWRKLAKTKRVGHLGTLDPLATGLLMLLTGPATRLARFFGKEYKTYLAGITFGRVSDTYDIEGKIVETGAALPQDPGALAAALERFRGRFLQTPPPFSAKKINGVPAYKLTRKQVPVALHPVEVEIQRIEIQNLSGSCLKLLVACAPGTYIRSLAHDLGQFLGCGAVLSNLRRIQVGTYTVDQARTIDELNELAANGRLSEAVIPAASLLPEIPSQHFDPANEAQIRQGRDFRTSPFVVPPGAPLIKALSSSGELIAIGELKIPNLYHPGTVL